MMRIIKVSPSTKRLAKEVKDKIHVFTQFFIHRSDQRRKEIKFCLAQNTLNPFITNVHLLNEKIYDDSELGISSPKIIQTNIGARLTFKSIAKYIREKKLTGYFIMANSDIFFTNEIENLFVSRLSTKKQMYALLRYEYNDSRHIGDSYLYGPRADSQDTWIYHSNYPLTEHQEKILNIQFGKPGCDNRIAYIYNILGYNILNDPLFIKSYHYHRQLERDYGVKDVIPEPYLFIAPSGGVIDYIIPSFGVNFKVLKSFTRNYTRMCNNDNTVIYEYINKKIQVCENFIIPRVSGIENNIAVLSKLFFDNNASSPEIIAYIKRALPLMKNNAGIKISGSDSLIAYSNKYLEAFDLCEIFGAWESWGKHMIEISRSYPYILEKYGRKDHFLSHSINVFINIYSDNIWTTAMRGKRILIISAFSESVKEKIPIREKIYGVDLFPGCDITTITPPQTHAGNDSREFTVELDEFYEKLEKIKDTYDIALVSAGGYSNLICCHIFKTGKSAVYVGGGLQMFFGIFGEKWLKEMPDIINLYLNEHWSRPKERERPKNYKSIENGCF